MIRIPAWIGVDLDKTLAVYDGWKGSTHIGAPIAPVVAYVKELLKGGDLVRIFTARVANPFDEPERAAEVTAFREAIKAWTLEHIGQELEATCSKDLGCIQIVDDRAKQVIPNTGIFVEDLIPLTAFGCVGVA